jgi:hyperosmotically inducible periplasmic protein
MTVRTFRRKKGLFIAAALVGALVASTGLQAQNVGVQETTLSLQKALERLPYYGVFDFLAFSLERGTVTLVGYAYNGNLKSDAEYAVKRVAGVDEVTNKLELLPPSLNDDRIRRAAFYNIYTDSFLSRYTPGGQRAALYEALEFGRFPGRQPFGTYPIHIVVKGGRMTLLGVVDNASDRQLAEFKAREVGGVFGVSNELVVR